MDTIQKTPLFEQNFVVLMPDRPDKDQYSRLLFFLDWLESQKIPWYRPALKDYKYYLLNNRTRPDSKTGAPRPARLSLATANTHIATIRGRYVALLHDNNIRQLLYDSLPSDLPAVSDRKAFVDEILLRLKNDLYFDEEKEVTIQDRSDTEHLRLTPAQVRALVRAPRLKTLPGVRDTALIALFVCTGIREAELVALDVEDLRQSLDGELALLIRHGKDNKQRLVPYGPLDWCLVYVDRWLQAAHITSGAVFRGLYKGNKRVRPTRITPRAVNLIMYGYPISIEGQLKIIQPHDLRRTYALNAYLHGMDMERIRQNLGHTSIDTTRVYIGTLSGSQRLPPDMFRLPHSKKELSLEENISKKRI